MRKYFYVGKQLKDRFSSNFIGKCARPAGNIYWYNMRIYRSAGVGQIPYLKLRYLVISSFPGDNYWFDSNAYTIHGDFDFPKKIIPDNYKDFVITDESFTRLGYETNLSTANLNTIKKFNNFDKYNDLNLEVAKTPYGHSYFLYDNDSLIRETFISELNKKVYLIGSITFYDEINKKGKAFLMRNKSKLKFDVKKNTVIDNFNFSLSHTNAIGQIKLKQQEIQNFMIAATEKLTRTGQKRKMVEVIDTIIIKALQNYDKYSTLNPLEINLNSNYLSKMIYDHKGFTFEVRLINVLFSSSITNDTQNVFITCQNLNSSKKALINNKIYGILGIINLNEIKKWGEMKSKSLYVNAKIDDSHYMESAKHFGFKFKTTFPTEFLEFTCEFLDDTANKKEFADNEDKVPIIDLQIDILR